MQISCTPEIYVEFASSALSKEQEEYLVDLIYRSIALP